MEGEADGNIEGEPRQIEECCRPAAGQKNPDGIEIAQRLRVASADRRLHLQPDDRIVDPWRKRLIEPIGDAHQQPASQGIEQALKGVKHDDDGKKCDQRRQAPAREHTIVHFHHEERSGEVEHIDDRTHQADADEGAGATGEYALELAGISIGRTVAHGP